MSAPQYNAGTVAGETIKAAPGDQVVVGGPGDDTVVVSDPLAPGRSRLLDGGVGTNALKYTYSTPATVVISRVKRDVDLTNPKYTAAPPTVVTVSTSSGTDYDYNFQSISLGTGKNTVRFDSSLTKGDLTNPDGSPSIKSFDGGSGGKNIFDLSATKGVTVTVTAANDPSFPAPYAFSIKGLSSSATPILATEFQNLILGSGDDTFSIDPSLKLDLSTLKSVDGGAGNNTITAGLGGKTVYYGGSYGHNVLTGPSTASGGVVRLVGGPSAEDIKYHTDNPGLPSLGQASAASYKITSGSSGAIMVGGAGTNEFYGGGVVWGGGGHSTYNVDGYSLGINIVHMDNPSAEKITALNFDYLDTHGLTIINPQSNDRISLGGKTISDMVTDHYGSYLVLAEANSPTLNFSEYKSIKPGYAGGYDDYDAIYVPGKSTGQVLQLHGFSDGNFGIKDHLPNFYGEASWSNGRATFGSVAISGRYPLNPPPFAVQPKSDPMAKNPGFTSDEINFIQSSMNARFAQFKSDWNPINDTPETINEASADGETLTPNRPGDTLIAGGKDIDYALSASNSGVVIDNFSLSNEGTIGHIVFDSSVKPSDLTVSVSYNGDYLLKNTASNKTTKIIKALSDPDYAIAGVRFADGTTWSSQALNDLSAAGTDSILWRGQGGETVVWQVQADGSYTATNVSSADPSIWTVIGYANGTGDGKSTVLWSNTGGDVYSWSLTDGVYTAGAYVGSTAGTESLKVAGCSNGAGAGKADVLVRGSAGSIFVWHLDPNAAQSQQYVGYADPNKWFVDGFSERTDGHTDEVLWHSAQNELSLWTVQDGVAITQEFLGLKDMTYWTVAGFGADAAMPGREEILWRGAAGETELSIITNGVLATPVTIGTRDPALWGVASFTNTIRNGEAEIVWRSTAGDTDVMRLQGTAVTSVSHLSPNVDQYWHVAG